LRPFAIRERLWVLVIDGRYSIFEVWCLLESCEAAPYRMGGRAERSEGGDIGIEEGCLSVLVWKKWTKKGKMVFGYYDNLGGR